jgi:hypothetical protein
MNIWVITQINLDFSGTSFVNRTYFTDPIKARMQMKNKFIQFFNDGEVLFDSIDFKDIAEDNIVNDNFELILENDEETAMLNNEQTDTCYNITGILCDGIEISCVINGDIIKEFSLCEICVLDDNVDIDDEDKDDHIHDFFREF